MTDREYIGERYVPIFGRKDENSINWDNSAPYEPLTIVLYQGNSFTSKQYVPTGIDISNQEYWAQTGNFNEQLEQYKQEVLAFDDRITENENDIAVLSETTPKFILCAIRNSGNGWEFINDSNHKPINVNSIEEVNSMLRINYSFTASKINSLVITGDERLSRYYTAGASVGNSSCDIAIYAKSTNIGGYVYYDETNSEWKINNSNFTSATFGTATGRLVLTFNNNLPSSYWYDIYAWSATGRQCNVQFGSIGQTSIEVYFLDSSGNIMYTPNSSMKAYITKSTGTHQVTPSDIVDAYGNFWVIGCFNVE